MSAGLSKELEETKAAMEHKNLELRQLKEDLAKEHELAVKQKAQLDAAERDLNEIKDELQLLKQKRQARQATDGSDPNTAGAAGNGHAGSGKRPDVPAEVFDELNQSLLEANNSNEKLKRQLQHVVIESNRRHTEQQNQLQGMDMVS
jgi:chromosome segregation ATPase